ncbi:MAG: ATP-binding protein [Verrucomicrobia bacterium]|nr:ATP-binding protein [Verrucomicrobiota bacterium]
MHKRPVFHQLIKRLREPRKFIQTLLGPRQVGKTTLALQALKTLRKPFHYISADLATLQNLSWLLQQWEIARNKVKSGKGTLLVIDEIQKIPHWAETLKSLWDEDTKDRVNLSVLLLGSSPWLMQQGLSESLAGRFEIIPITHWSLEEMQKNFKWSLDKYIYFGGYPGAATLAHINDVTRWANYINESLIETTLSRDILLMTQVNKPALLRRLFQLGCSYSGQILSFSKVLGELQDAGNTTTLAHYLELLSGAGLICGIQKFANQKVRQKGSSPKFCVYNTALMSAQCPFSYKAAKKNPSHWGHLVESAVGAYLLNSIRGTNIELFYWREGDKEVDYVLRHGKSITAIEVKSTKEKLSLSGMDDFVKQFKPSKILLVGPEGIPLEEFLKTPIQKFIN